jgi:hypothetical protein
MSLPEIWTSRDQAHPLNALQKFESAFPKMQKQALAPSADLSLRTFDPPRTLLGASSLGGSQPHRPMLMLVWANKWIAHPILLSSPLKLQNFQDMDCAVLPSSSEVPTVGRVARSEGAPGSPVRGGHQSEGAPGPAAQRVGGGGSVVGAGAMAKKG